MNYLEFKRQLMVDPYTRDAAFQEAKTRDPQCARAARATLAFEQKLRAALNVGVPGGLAEQIILHQSLQAARRPVWPQALAASFAAALLTFGLLTWMHQREIDEFRTFVAEHWNKDGSEILSRATSGVPVDAAEFRAVLAAAGLDADEALTRQVAYAKNCQTPKGLGVHLVLRTAEGLVTVFYAPDLNSRKAREMTVDDLRTLLVGLQDGSIAVLGKTEAGIGEARETVARSFKPLATTRT